MNNLPQRCHSRREAQKILRCGRPCLDALIASGELRAVRLGTLKRPRTLIPHEALERFLASREVVPQVVAPKRRCRKPAGVDFFPDG
jgi:excisionase family DNA binding protein